MAVKTTSSTKQKKNENKITVGWREWFSLPDLGIAAIKAKVDTGARTSAIHAFALEEFEDKGQLFVRFRIHPMQRNTALEIECVAPVVDQRIVRDSGGHAERRYVIETGLQIGTQLMPIEATLTSREDMLFKMLLGRTAMTSSGIIVDPSRSYKLGRKLASAYKKPSRHGDPT